MNTQELQTTPFHSYHLEQGAKMVDFHEKNCRCLDIRMCMMCVAHDDNTISKDNFNKDELVVECDLHDGIKQLILSCLD